MPINSKKETSAQPCPLNQGMPVLDMTGKPLSWFEFLPTFFFYIPVVFLWIWLGFKYRNLALPLIANPGIPLSGMVGESKNEILSLAGNKASSWILPYVMWRKNTQPSSIQAQNIISRLQEKKLTFPLVIKPDIGCRGAGVRLIENSDELEKYLLLFPNDSNIMIQKKAPFSAEAGVFYVRYPGESHGKIISMTFKYNPFVIGDGVHTLGELIDNDPRAGKVRHLYRTRHRNTLPVVLQAGEVYRLTFSGSHCCGSIFRNANEYITEDLVSAFDEIINDLPGYYFGRIDLKFKNIDSLMRGEGFNLIEINGASSEAAHIWDRNTTLKEALSTLLNQYQILFKIGSMQRDSGIQAPKFMRLWQAWRKESALVKRYPSTD